jgi:hypothetical protein
MPTVVEIPDIGVVEFPDGMSREEMEEASSKFYHRQVTQPAQMQALERSSDRMRFISDAADALSAGNRRISLGGIGSLAGAVATDVMTPGLLPAFGGGTATAAELQGEPTPDFQRQMLEDSLLKSSVVTAARSAPVVGAAIASGPALGLAAMPAAMGASAAEETDYDPWQTAKAVAIGAALPGISKLARVGAANVMGAAANRGATALAGAGAQRAGEFAASQAAVQGTMMADLMTSEQFRNATPEQQRRMLAESGFSNALFGVQDVVAAARARPLTESRLKPEILLAREIQNAELNTGAVVNPRANAQNQVTPTGVVPPVERASSDTSEPITGIDTALAKTGETPPTAAPALQPGTVEKTPVPEPASTIAEQVRLTADPNSTRKATLITPGEQTPDYPDELMTVKTKHGLVIFNPEKIDATEVRDAASGDQFDARILGLSSGAEPVESPLAVTTSTPAASNVQSEVVAPNKTAIEKAAEAQQAAAPGGTTEVKPAIQLAQERTIEKAQEEGTQETGVQTPTEGQASQAGLLTPQPLYHGSFETGLTQLSTSRYGDFGSGVYLTSSPEFAGRFADSTNFDVAPDVRKSRGRGRVYRVNLSKGLRVFTADKTPLTKEEKSFWESTEEGLENDVNTREDLRDAKTGRNLGPLDRTDWAYNSKDWDAFASKFGYDALQFGDEIVVKDRSKVSVDPDYTAPPAPERTIEKAQEEGTQETGVQTPTEGQASQAGLLTAEEGPPATFEPHDINVAKGYPISAGDPRSVPGAKKEQQIEYVNALFKDFGAKGKYGKTLRKSGAIIELHNRLDPLLDEYGINKRREYKEPETGRIIYVGKPLDQVKSELLAAIESGNRQISVTDSIVGFLEASKIPTKGVMLSSILPPNVYNAAIDVAIKAVKAGKSAKAAIDEAVGYAKKRGKLTDEQGLRAALASGIASKTPAGDERPTRKLMARAQVSPDIPEPVREALKNNPEQFYDQQNVPDIVEEARGKSDAEVQAGMLDKDSNVSVAHGAVLIERAIAKRDDAGTESLIVGMAKRGTTLGQLVNQFKLIQGLDPEHMATVVDKWLKHEGYDPLNPAQRTKITKLSKANIEAEVDRKQADSTYRKTPTPDNWRAVSDADGAGGQASLELNEYLSNFQPRSIPETLVAIFQGNLLTPASQVANVAGNAVRLPLAASTRTIGAIADAVESTVSGKPRTQKVYPIENTLAKIRAAPRTLKAMAKVVKHGADTSNWEAGQHAGVRLNAFRAMRELRDILKRQADLPTKGGHIPFADVANRVMEATFGLPADVMFRGLGAMDAGFRIPERARLINEAAHRRGLSPEQRLRAAKRPDLLLPKDELKRIEFEASRAVYQQDNKITGFVARANQALRSSPWLYALSKTLVPYQKTPINVFAELLTYDPFFGTLKLAHDIKTGNRHEANLQAGKVIVGGMATAATVWLMRNGLMTPPLDASDESQKARIDTQSGSIPPSHINLSGLKRHLKGEDGSPRPDDRLIDVTRLGLPGGIVYKTAIIMRQMEKMRDGGTFAADMAIKTPIAVARWALNQVFLQGVSDFIKATQNETLDRWATTWLTGISAVPLPNTLASISRAMRDAKPEFRDDSALKAIGNKINEKANVLGFSVPFGKETKALPLKIDLWGRPMKQTPAGANPFIYNFFDVSHSGEIPNDPVSIELYGIWRRTTDNAVFPSLPERMVTVRGQQKEPLTYEQYQEYATFIGQERRKAVETLINRPEWINKTDQEKLRHLKRYYDHGRDRGVSLWKQTQPELTPRRQRVGVR